MNGQLSWQLRLVGVVRMCLGDGTRVASDMGSRKARTLIALLGASCGRLVSVDEVVDALWDDHPPDRPGANVATLVSRLRARFGPDLIAGDRRGYRLGHTARVDLQDAAGLVADAEFWLRDDDPVRCLMAAEKAMTLLGGGLVLAEHPVADWAERARLLQAGLQRRARLAAADGSLRTGDPGRAQVLAETAIAADPLDEAAYRAFMRACAEAGEPARAVLAYQRLRLVLSTELGIDPAGATLDLHVSILRDNTLAASA
jgi:DNA-binding SARP family transcriptional activator